MTLQQFSKVFVLLAVQLRFTDADEATIRGYFKALSDVEPELIALAAERFARGAALNEQGEAWFPKAPEWRAMAMKVQRDRGLELDAIIRKRLQAGQVLCNDCEDTGWRLVGARYRGCPCREMRRLEILGRRPMPALPSEPASDATQLPTALALAGKHVKGMR